MNQFIPTRQGNPCCLCGNTTSKCRQVEALHLCMNFTDQHTAVPGFRFIKRTKGSDLWGIWREDDGQAWSEAQREQWRREQQQLKSQRESEETQRRAAALSAVERDRYYQQLLDQLVLHPTDRADLQRRGLSEAQIQACGCKSIEKGQQLERALPPTLPGVSLTGRELYIAGSGYLCPIRDVEGLLVSCQMRLRTACKNRYRWLSSSIASPHSTNGELPLAVHRPAHIQRQAIALVEGTGPKPLILCLRQKQLTVGAASGHASSPQTLKHTLQVLATEQKTKEVEFYPDAGAVTNHHVLRQYRATWRLLHQWGYSIRVAWWGQVAKAVGDIDEIDI